MKGRRRNISHVVELSNIRTLKSSVIGKLNFDTLLYLNYSNCHNIYSWALLPGITTLHPVLLAIVYMVALFWMFLGMNIIADIFMK